MSSLADPRVILAGIVLLAIAVRLAAISSRVHVDDAYSWLVASQPSAHAFLHQLAASENTPPLFYLLLTALPIDHVVWLRLPALLPGILMCPVLYLAVRRSLGERAALLSALAVAVSPFLVSYSDLGRGFMLADLALLVCLWAVLRLSEQESRRWWITFVVAGVVAVYTEYYAVIFLVALAAAALIESRPPGRPRRGWMAAMTALPLLALVPWIPQIVRGQHQVHITKLDPLFATPNPTSLRDAILTLTLGEHGGAAHTLARWGEFAVIVLIAILAAVALRASWGSQDNRFRYVIRLLAVTGALTLAGHALAAVVGVDVFTQRYMTILIPVGAALGAAALVATRSRPLLIGAAAVLLAVGVGGFLRRLGAQYEPDFKPVARAASAAHPRTVLTNTPIVLFYLRSLHPQLDRPANLGPGLASSCARPCLIIDDTRVRGGHRRHVGGARTSIRPFILTVER
jgi:uncharacterized membrane protein